MISNNRRPTSGLPLSRREVMPKGHKCPVCDKFTLQPYTTNQLKCSNCDTVVKKDQIL